MDARPLHLVLALLGAVLLAGRGAAAQSVIELRTSVKAAPGSAVTLAQVATLVGPEAQALGGMTVMEALGGEGSQKTVTTDELRLALSARHRVNWGRITLRGSKCTITAAPEAPARPAPAAKAPESAPRPADPDSIRFAVAERISRLVQAGPEDLRLSFAPEDEELLNTRTTGRTLEIKPTAASDKLPLALTLYDRDRIVANKTIRVGVLVKKTVVIAAAAKARGDTINADDVTTDEQWVGPNLKAASPEQVIGSAAQGRIATGQVFTVSDVAPPVIVSKGELVSVSCVSGSIVLTTRARAMSAGRVGEVIQFQALDDKRTFSARMNGRGRAVVTVDAAPTPKESSP